jgi:large subunit ribosomal protein L25
MASNDTTSLKVAPRAAEGSRATRRLRRSGDVPGIVYGGGQDPVPFKVNERTLRHALQDAGAVLQLDIDGSDGGPVVVKEVVRHPVTGLTTHLDLLRVRLDVKIQSTVPLELTGAEDAEGVKLGGILEQPVRELNIEALPNDIPDAITHDVTAMQIGDTLTLDAITAPGKVEILDDPETVIATLTPPRLQDEAEDEIETETEVVGEGEAEAAASSDEDAGESGSDDAE